MTHMWGAEWEYLQLDHDQKCKKLLIVKDLSDSPEQIWRNIYHARRHNPAGVRVIAPYYGWTWQSLGGYLHMPPTFLLYAAFNDPVMKALWLDFFSCMCGTYSTIVYEFDDEEFWRFLLPERPDERSDVARALSRYKDGPVSGEVYPSNLDAAKTRCFRRMLLYHRVLNHLQSSTDLWGKHAKYYNLERKGGLWPRDPILDHSIEDWNRARCFVSCVVTEIKKRLSCQQWSISQLQTLLGSDDDQLRREEGPALYCTYLRLEEANDLKPLIGPRSFDYDKPAESEAGKSLKNLIPDMPDGFVAEHYIWAPRVPPSPQIVDLEGYDEGPVD